jgi:hypothetical protein
METNFVVPSSESSRAGASFFYFYDAVGRQSGSTARQLDRLQGERARLRGIMTTTNRPPAGASLASQTKKNQRSVSSERKLIVNQSKVKCFFCYRTTSSEYFSDTDFKKIIKNKWKGLIFKLKKRNPEKRTHIHLKSAKNLCSSSSCK